MGTRRLRRIGMAIVMAAGGLLAWAPPTGAQVPPSSPIQLDQSSGPVGTTISASGTCAQGAGTFAVRLVADGGSNTVTLPAPNPGTFWFTTLTVPWSAQPGPASVTTTCSTHTSGPTPFTVTSGVPAAPVVGGVVQGNGYIQLTVNPSGPPWLSPWTYSVITTRDGAVDRWVNFDGNTGAFTVPAPNGVPIDVYVIATNRHGASPASAPVHTSASASGPVAQPPSAPEVTTAAGHGWGAVSATWFNELPRGSAVFGYSMAAVRRGTSTVAGSIVVPADVHYGSIEGLAPGDYDVYVAGLNSVGYGVPAVVPLTVPATPATRVPPPAPNNLAVRHTAAGTVVSWRGVNRDLGSPILGYAVVATQGGQVVAWTNVGSNVRTTTLTELQGALPETTISVLALSRGGFGAPITTVTGG